MDESFGMDESFCLKCDASGALVPEASIRRPWLEKMMSW